jgi:hypothetical protein
MWGWEILAVVVGVAGALVGIYFRESLSRAYRQKQLAGLLEAQISDLYRGMVKNENLLPFVVLANKWTKEESQAIASDGTAGFLKIQEQHEKSMDQIKEAIESGNPEIDESLSEQYEIIHEMPERAFDYMMAQLEISRDNLMNGISLISDEAAAELSWHTAHRVVQLRNTLIYQIHYILTMNVAFREMEEFDLDAARDIIFSIVKNMIEVTMIFEPLKTAATVIRNTKPLRLALKNMVR